MTPKLSRARASARARRRRAGAPTLLGGCAPLVIGGAVVGGAMVATDRRTSGAQVEDEAIELKAGSRMGEACSATAATSTSPATTAMVLLTGEVPTEADKAAVEQAVAAHRERALGRQRAGASASPTLVQRAAPTTR